MTALGDDGLVTFKSSGGQSGAVNPCVAGLDVALNWRGGRRRFAAVGAGAAAGALAAGGRDGVTTSFFVVLPARQGQLRVAAIFGGPHD